jgi:signal transduction histidine kinase
MARGEVTRHDCPGGMRVYAVPIRAGDEIIGSISVGCGGPPSDEAELSVLAERLCTPLERLRAEAARIKPFSEELEPMASHAIEATARLIGEIVTRRRGAIEREDAHDLWVGMIAHDLRVPLSAALMAAELLKLPASRERVTELAQRIERSANKMRRMVEDLLEATRARLGSGIRLQLSRTSLDALAADAIDELKLSLPDQLVHWHSEGNTELQCDAVRLDELIGNLLANAARYGSGLPIHVDAVGSAEQVVLRVHNFGPPIPAELLPTIFAPFEQGRARVGNGRSAGLGLGLHIAREIAHAHGGTIEVESSAADGTAFTLCLPRSAPGSLQNAGHTDQC